MTPEQIEQIKQIARDVYEETSAQDQFAVSTTPYHTHNGADSPLLKFIKLVDVPIAYYGNAGRTVLVNSTATGLEFSGGVLATTATTGFIMLPTCAGAPTGVPTNGNGAVVYDTTNNKLYVYNGAWKSVALT